MKILFDTSINESITAGLKINFFVRFPGLNFLVHRLNSNVILGSLGDYLGSQKYFKGSHGSWETANFEPWIADNNLEVLRRLLLFFTIN